jgi:putative transposase
MSSETFHLAAPPGFRGLDPGLPVEFSHRQLPHWRQTGATYFATFRLAESIPREHVRSLRRWRENWEHSHPEPRTEQAWEELARETASRTEASLDQGHGECFFREPELAEELSRSLLFFQDDRHLTSCFTIMPNHVHLVMKPLGDYELGKILGSVKGFVSRKVNAYLGREGTLWAQENHDRIIRDEEHLWSVVQYIGRNPAKAGLPDDQWCRWIHPDWKAAGWGFQDSVR